MGTPIGTSKFEPKMKTLTLIMHSNLYPLSNTGFIYLGREKFLCDVINGAQIDICTNIFQIMGKTARRSVSRTCLPFCSLVMKIMTLKGICPPKGGTVLPRQGTISLHSLQKSKGHSSAERAKKSPSKPLESESSHHASPIGKSSIDPNVSENLETTSPHIPKPHPSSTQPGPSISHLDKLMTLIEGLHDCISGLANVIYSHNNHVQIRLTTIVTQLDEIQCKLEESL